jgi:predicted nuclease of restriction endonuclease-like RecB superfamily
MLPSNLLVARVRGGRIEPLLLEPEGIPLAIAAEILDRLRDGVGRSRRELERELGELEELALEAGLDLRVARAMAALALRASVFEPVKAPVDPVRARLEVFEEACRSFGVAVGEEERRAVLERAAARLGCRVEDLEAVLAEYQDEVLSKPPDMSAEDLVKEYNLAEVQTLLFKALKLDARFVADGATTKRLLRAVKALGLLYVAEKAGEGVRLTIDGPASLLRQTRRYGTRLAKLIPHVMLADRWAIEADIAGRVRTLKFELADARSHLFPRRSVEVEPLFDSEVEREFFKSLSRLAPGWKVEREPEPLVAGSRILIPDFSVSCGDRKVYIEIVGFWTKEYLERKLEKLRELKGVAMIVAVDEELACSSVKDLPHEVVLFRGKLRGADVYPLLRKLLGEPERAARPEPQREPEVPALPDLSGKTLAEAVSELGKAGVDPSKALEVLERLGYTVEWRSLDPSKARVRRARAEGV